MSRKYLERLSNQCKRMKSRSHSLVICLKGMMAHRTKRKKLWKTYKTRKNTTPTPEPQIIVKNYVTCSVQTDDELPTAKKRQFALQDLESFNRITNLPIVESGWDYAENIYNRVKKSNNLVFWTLNQAENSVQLVWEVATPAIVLLQKPLSSVDKLICKSLDVVEQTVPSINLPPEMIYWNTKQYVTDVGTKLAKPVLKRADSVKQLGNQVLANKYTVFAATSLDGALDVAEKYVDKYLPASDDHGIDEVDHPMEDGPTGRAIHTMHHAKGLSRKLRRRLTQRTIAEVKALKQQSAEAVHVLVYVVELIAKDPALAFQKGKELWASLSKDEPENQARPENLEQLIVLLTRESARRVVHLVNFSSAVVSTVPRRVSHSVTNMVRRMLTLADSMVKTVHLEHVQKTVVDILKIQGYHAAKALKQLNNRINDLLDEVEQNLAQKEPQKTGLSVPKIRVQALKATNTSVPNSPKAKINGLENNF